MIPDKSSRLWNLVKMLLAFFLIGFVFSKTNLRELASLDKDISYGWLISSLLFFCLMTFLKAGQYYFLIGNKVNFSSVLRIVIWQNALSNFIANSAGIASYLAMFRAEQDVKLSRSGVTLIITKAGDLLAICFFLALSAWLVWPHISILHGAVVLLIAGMLFVLTVFLVAILVRERFVALVRQVLGWLHLSHLELVKRGLNTLQSLAEQEQRAILKMLRTGFRLSLVYMSATMLFAYASIKIFAVPIDVWAVIFVASLMQLITFIPIQVLGGLGVSEVTSVYLYSIFGMEQTEMAAVMIGLRAIFYLMNLIVLLYLPLSAFVSKIVTSYPGQE